MSKEVAENPLRIATEEKSMNSWTPSEKESSKKKYSCEIMIENGTWEQVNTTDCPNDARIVTYEVNGETRYDLTRSQKAVYIFNMYYDKFGKDMKNIEYGQGRINPKLWGYQAPQSKKKK
jgi:hypothetical protein